MVPKQILFSTTSQCWGRNRSVISIGLVLYPTPERGELIMRPIAKQTEAETNSVELRVPLNSIPDLINRLTEIQDENSNTK